MGGQSGGAILRRSGRQRGRHHPGDGPVKRHRGFSLVELMIAITLALLLTGAVIAVFIGSRSAYESTAGVGDMSDSGRMALNLIGESVRSAGSLACNSAMTATSQNVVVNPGAFDRNFGQGVTGFE